MQVTLSSIESFLKRWNELSDSLKRSPEVISDFQINCADLMSNVDSLAKACEYFSLAFPDSFAHLKTVSLEVQDLYAKFHILYEFEQGLAPYLDMEWIVCRNKLAKISQYISEWLDQSSNGENVLLKNHLESWKRLLALLELCRGDFYQQLHWQQLLNLLGCDRSFEELKLADLATKKEILVEHRSAILELNKR